jgi:hypothetical protein
VLNTAALRDAILRIGALAAAHPAVAELDCDPLGRPRRRRDRRRAGARRAAARRAALRVDRPLIRST